MHRIVFALIVAALLAAGCRGKGAADASPGNDIDKPPVVDGGIQQGTNSGLDSHQSSTDPGRIIQPTEDDSPQRAQVREMDTPQLVAALGDDKLASAASDELAARGSDAAGPLMEALDGGDPRIQQNAIFTLGRLGEAAKDAVPKLQEIAEGGPSEVERDAARFAIDAIEGK